MAIVLPTGGAWQIFARSAIVFALGAAPLRHWTRRHRRQVPMIPGDVAVFAVVGIVKLALIQFFLRSSPSDVVGVQYQAAMLHASLGFAVQEFLFGLKTASLTGSCRRYCRR